jgi:hypothetical protein
LFSQIKKQASELGDAGSVYAQALDGSFQQIPHQYQLYTPIYANQSLIGNGAGNGQQPNGSADESVRSLFFFFVF